MSLRCALYARYSSDLQNKASIEDQFRLCAARADREGWTVVSSFHDAAISGATTLRPGYQALLEAMRTAKVDVVLAESLDRFSRDLEHIAAFHKQAVFARVRLITLAEGEVSELHVGLKGTMGAVYLKDLADKTRRGLAGRVRQGRSVGRVPYGYRAIRGRLGPDGEPERGLREIHPVEANVIRRIFREYIGGLSPMVIARTLNAEGVPGPNGGLWYDATIRGRARRGDGMLRAAIYVGRLVWNRRRTHKHPDTGRAHRRPNDPEDIVIQDVPEYRIVDPETWDAAQARLARDAAPMAPTGRARFWDTRRPHYLLTGKVVCGCCGALFTPVGKDYLACRARRTAGCRNTTRVRRGPLETRVLEALGSRLMDPELAEVFVREFTREWNRLAVEEAGARTGQRTELAAVERKIANLVEALADGVASGGAVSTKVAELERRADVLRAAVAAAPPDRPRLHPGLAEVYRDRVARIRDAVAGDESAEALEAARALIDKVIVSGPPDGGGPPGIELVGDLPEMLKAAGALPVQPDSQDRMVGHLRAPISSAKGDQGGLCPPDKRPTPSSPPSAN